ncbi:MAG: flagellar biosynthetic protein FliQ [Chlamydiales bacterium]
MTPEQITYIVRQTLYTAIEISTPFLLLAMIVGLIISLIQSITQIQEMTLTFVPKILLLAFALTLFFPWILKILTKFTNNLLIHQWDKVSSLVNYIQ